MNLNREELLIGLIYGLCFIFLIGWWAILVAILCSLLWASGGRFGHSIRVFGVPVVSYGSVLIIRHHYWSILSMVFTMLILSIGYGQVTIENGIITDNGSALGRFWYRIDKENANFWTRVTIYLLLVIAYFPSL